VMLSIVKWCKSNLPWGMPAALEFGVRVRGEHKKQNAIPSTVRFCWHNSGPITIRNHHSTFDYAIPFSYLPEEDTINYSTIMSAIAPIIIFNSFTPIRVRAGKKNSRPVGFLR
jgi:hypothetical protein